MKIWNVFCILCSFVIILSGCTQQEKVKQPRKQAIPETDEYGGIQLTKVGQEIKEKNWGTLTLEQIKHVNETFTVGTMKIYVENVRVITLSNMESETKETLKMYTKLTPEEVQRRLGETLEQTEAELYASLSGQDIGDTAKYLEITYKVENAGDKEMQFFSMNDVTVNEKQQFHVPTKNFLYAEDTLVGTKSVTREDYSSGETREGLIGLLLSDNNEKVKTISFTTDILAIGDIHEKIAEPQTFTISL
ncbi:MULTISPECIES: hypothetical protein [unclassified Bacillus (in: firmicutes)]|uniref:hypothetical protein n=1 Tax=unclassified Bacillus (in: firmicutes) TaxID=185979 RepID=UPI0008EC859D|nr:MULTISPECIES: hypothetical protein [unclassified Bacillus (in: firmicutes)]SFI56442.1 hypothetical protein SAMN04488574_103276 [Bacillus sp. 71mf]SFS46270.1 hypothetical protein SAMN04488145_101626 [Bacillus sp. 103mf]